MAKIAWRSIVGGSAGSNAKSGRRIVGQTIQILRLFCCKLKNFSFKKGGKGGLLRLVPDEHTISRGGGGRRPKYGLGPRYGLNTRGRKLKRLARGGVHLAEGVRGRIGEF